MCLVPPESSSAKHKTRPYEVLIAVGGLSEETESTLRGGRGAARSYDVAVIEPSQLVRISKVYGCGGGVIVSLPIVRGLDPYQ